MSSCYKLSQRSGVEEISQGRGRKKALLDVPYVWPEPITEQEAVLLSAASIKCRGRNQTTKLPYAFELFLTEDAPDWTIQKCVRICHLHMLGHIRQL